MKITFDCADKINGLLTMTVEPAEAATEYFPDEEDIL